jgi:hypothetical protein
MNTLAIIMACLPITGAPTSTAGTVSGGCTTLADQPTKIQLADGTTQAECEQIIKHLPLPIARASPGLIATWVCGYSSSGGTEEQGDGK